MQIIFGSDNIEKLQEKYMVLELDTVETKPGETQTAYAVIEQLNINDIPELEQFKNLHSKLMENYRKKNWNFCEQAIDHLKNRWSGELKSFYDILGKRIKDYQETDPGEDFDGVVRN